MKNFKSFIVGFVVTLVTLNILGTIHLRWLFLKAFELGGLPQWVSLHETFPIEPEWLKFGLNPKSKPYLGTVTWVDRGESSSTVEVLDVSGDLVFEELRQVKIDPLHLNSQVYWNPNSSTAADKSADTLGTWAVTNALSLKQLTTSLADTPLEIGFALSLDAGPLASTILRVPGYSKTVYGRYEIAEKSDHLALLTAENEEKKWTLPIMLSVQFKY